MPVMVFDIETVPDVAMGRRILNLPDSLPNESVAKAMQLSSETAQSSGFVKLPLQQIVAISVVFASQHQVKVWSLGELDSDEASLITRFFKGIDDYRPTLVSWNGTGFDCPVLHYRSLKHGISAANYWDTGWLDQASKWHNYTNRYHEKHLDLMEVLASFQPRANASLELIATMNGYPGKMGMAGHKVQEAYFNGELSAIRNYCETDVLNTYGVYLKFERMRGKLSETSYQDRQTELMKMLNEADESHLNEFARAIQTG